MAFLTGVDLEGHLKEEPQPLFALPAPPRPAPKKNKRDDLVALGDIPRPKIEYKQLLQDVSSYNNEEDPLSELRRLINKTRKKMDSQTKVLNGFISDVNQIKGQERSFSCTDLATCSTPSSSGSAAKALRAPESRMMALRGTGGSVPALGDRPTPASSSSLALPGAPQALAPQALAALPAPTSAAFASASAAAPSASSAPSAAAALMRRRPPSGEDSRGLVKRSGTMASSRSTPALFGGVTGGPGGKDPFATLQMPARRPPPGALGLPKTRSELRAAASMASDGASASPLRRLSRQGSLR